MATPFDCPGIECWQDLLDVNLAPDKRGLFERHLQLCPACQVRLDRAAEGEEELRRRARRVGDPTIAPTDPTLVQFLVQLREGKALVPAVSAEPADLFFLLPSGRPDFLGTLDDYEVREVIGEGGMGVVLKAYEPALQRLVAIKVPAPALAGSSTARRRFIREALAAAAICHDHVVAVHGVHEVAGLPYLVMQYIPGESLQQRLDRCGPLGLEEVVRIGMQTAAGLAAAHAQGLIHRDIKPANLLLEDEPGAYEPPGLSRRSAATGVRVKITDFGLARMIDDVGLTQSGVVAGTPEYMAPEQARCEPVDHRADLFSLGSVLYACCTGVPPFQGGSAMAVLRRVSGEEPTRVRELNPDIPAWLEDLIVRLLAKDPEQRIQSAAEIAALLEGYLAHLRQPVALPPMLPSSPRPARMSNQADKSAPARRSLALLVLLVLVVLGLGGSFRVLTALFQEEPSAADPGRAVEALEKIGGKITRSETLSNRPVVAVDLKHTKVTDADLKYLRALPQLQTLELGGTAVTDAGVKELTSLQQLQRLEISGTAITDEALRHIASLGQLRALFLGRTAVTDIGLSHLLSLRHLQSLGLEATQVTDAGMRIVGRVKGLRYLNIGRTKITDRGMQELVGLTEMRMLCLYFTRVTDAGIMNLLAFTELERLLIGGTEVTDAGLRQLAALKQLQAVEVGGSKVTEAGLKELPVAVPIIGRDLSLAAARALRTEQAQPARGHVAFPDGIPTARAQAPATSAEAPPEPRRKGLLTAIVLTLMTLLGVGAVGVWLYARQRSDAGRKVVPASAQRQQPEPEATPAAVPVQCPQCGKTSKARPGLAGKKVKCPQCGHSLLVPEPGPAVPRKARFSAWTGWLLASLGLVLALLCLWFFRPARPAPPSFLNVTLGNQSVPGMEESGFYNDEHNEDGPFRWTDGKARLVIPLDKKEPPQALYVQLHRPKDTWLQITVNDRELVNEKSSDRQLPWWERTLDLGDIDLGETLVLEIVSNTVVPKSVDPLQSEDTKALGVKVRGIKLLGQRGRDQSPATCSFLNVTLGNRFIPGVEDSGYYSEERDGDGLFRWTDGKGRLVIPLDKKEPPQALLVRLDKPQNRYLKITVNHRELVNEPANERARRRWERTFDLGDIDLGEQLVVEIESNTTVPEKDTRPIGVQVREIKLLPAGGGDKMPLNAKDQEAGVPPGR